MSIFQLIRQLWATYFVDFYKYTPAFIALELRQEVSLIQQRLEHDDKVKYCHVREIWHHHGPNTLPHDWIVAQVTIIGPYNLEKTAYLSVEPRVKTTDTMLPTTDFPLPSSDMVSASYIRIINGDVVESVKFRDQVPLRDLCRLVRSVSKAGPDYNVTGTQCYWFARIICAAAQRLWDGTFQDGEVQSSGSSGSPDNKRVDSILQIYSELPEVDQNSAQVPEDSDAKDKRIEELLAEREQMRVEREAEREQMRAEMDAVTAQVNAKDKQVEELTAQVEQLAVQLSRRSR